MMIHKNVTRLALMLSLWAGSSGIATTQESGPALSERTDSPVATTSDDLATLSKLAEAQPDDVGILLRLGEAQLAAGLYSVAEKTFERARDLDKDRPEAYVGLGRVHVERPAKGTAAFFGSRRALGLARRASKIDSTYAPAYRLLGELYERFQEDHAKAVESYLKYVTLEPDNADGLYYFGLALVQAGEYDKIDQHIAQYVDSHPEEEQLLPLVAMGNFYLERYEAALELFERFLQRIPADERARYVDISLAASEKEMHALGAIEEPEARTTYLDLFWLRRDSDILTSIN